MIWYARYYWQDNCVVKVQQDFIVNCSCSLLSGSSFLYRWLIPLKRAFTCAAHQMIIRMVRLIFAKGRWRSGVNRLLIGRKRKRLESNTDAIKSRKFPSCLADWIKPSLRADWNRSTNYNLFECIQFLINETFSVVSTGGQSSFCWPIRFITGLFDVIPSGGC